MRTLVLSALTALACSAAFSSTATAQTTSVPITVPSLYKNTFATTRNLLPYGRTKSFIQTWYSGTNLPNNTVVTAMGIRTNRGATQAARTHKLEIVLDSTKTTFSGISKTFTQNLSAKPTTFFKMKNLSLPAFTNHQDPNQPVVWIPGNTVFIYTGPNLLVQFDVQTGTSPSSLPYYSDSYIGSPMASSGKSCGKSTLSQRVGTTYDLTVSGAPATVPVLFHVGLNNQTSNGARLPVDLSIIGMKNCNLYLHPLLTVGALTNGSGSVTLNAPRTVGAFTGFVQASHPETGANTANYVATNMVGRMFSGTGISTYLYNWSSFGPTAQYGPYSSNRGAVLLFR